MSGDPAAVAVVAADEGPELAIVEGPGSARAVIWPGMGAELRSMHRLSLGGGARTVELRHPSDAVYYVISGDGRVRDCDTEASEALVPGSMVHVDRGTAYQLAAADGGMELVGGPAPADPGLYPAAGR